MEWLYLLRLSPVLGKTAIDGTPGGDLHYLCFVSGLYIKGFSGRKFGWACLTHKRKVKAISHMLGCVASLKPLDWSSMVRWTLKHCSEKGGANFGSQPERTPC